MVETPEETRRLLELTDVSLCLDTGHWWLAGGDPTEAVREFGQRIRQIHLKDASRETHARVRDAGGDLWAVVAAGAFAPLGRGDIDFPAFLNALKTLGPRGYEGWLVVEQDVVQQDVAKVKAPPPPNPTEPPPTEPPPTTTDQQANREFLRREGL